MSPEDLVVGNLYYWEADGAILIDRFIKTATTRNGDTSYCFELIEKIKDLDNDYNVGEIYPIVDINLCYYTSYSEMLAHKELEEELKEILQ